MFTLSDICDIAIQIERNGEETYRRAGKETPNTENANILNIMADDEKRHAQWFEHLRDADNRLQENRQIAEMGRELLQNMMSQQTFSLDSVRLANANDPEALIRQSMEFENDTIIFYEMLQSFLDKPDTANRLALIIKEEQDHIDKLKQMLERHLAEKHAAT